MVNVDAMQHNEAISLLRLGLPQGNDSNIRRLAARLGEWALILKLVNSALPDRVHNTGQSLSDAVSYVNRALDACRLTVFDARDVASREQAATKTLIVSLELLKSEEIVRYKELAIFPKDVDITLYTLEKLLKKAGGFTEFELKNCATA